MRATRWTRKRRATYRGKGGWYVDRYGLMYCNPVTGDAVSAGWNLRRLLRMRADQEARKGRERAQRALDAEFRFGFDAGRRWGPRR